VQMLALSALRLLPFSGSLSSSHGLLGFDPTEQRRRCACFAHFDTLDCFALLCLLALRSGPCFPADRINMVPERGRGDKLP
jgi:hypothetical protein